MTIAQLARRPTPESPWESVEQDREEYHRQREVALRAYEEALAKPEAKTALAVRAAASAATSQDIGDIAERWVAEHASGQVVANVPVDDQAKVIFQIQAVRELAPERQKRLVRRLGDIVALGADALKSMPIEDIRAALTAKGYPIRRVRDAVFAVRVYRSAIAVPAVQPLKMISLFAGIDAASHAASLIGDGKRIETVAVAEVEPYPIAVIRRHYPTTPNLHDVTKIDWQKAEETLGKIDIITAGFPCQDFSRAGHQEGLNGDESVLFFEAMRAAKALQPKYIVLENVAAVFDANHRKDFLTIVRECKKAGYILDVAGLDAIDFGLPMLRPRFYAVGIRRDLAKWFPRRRPWRYHDVAPEKAKVEMVDKGLARRLGQNLDARTDIGKALENARWLREDGSRVRRPRFRLLGGFVTAHHVPQPSWLGDVIDRDPPASTYLNEEALRQTLLKWGVIQHDEAKDGPKKPKVLKPELEALHKLGAFAHRYERARGDNGAPIDLDDCPHPIAHGIAHTLHQRGRGYALGGLGIRPHSMYTITTHSGWAVVQEGRPRLLSHDEMDVLMGFPRGYSYVGMVDGKEPSLTDRQAAIGNSMAVPCIQAALEGVLIAEMCLRGMQI